jgi:hypothetical protein
MATDQLSFTSVQALTDLLDGAGVKATLDPSELNLPGVWITVDTFQARTLNGGIRLTVSLWLIVPNVDPVRALEQLADLWRTVRTLVTPDGPTTTTSVILPGNPTEAMPAFRFPLYLPGSAPVSGLSDYVTETV